MWHYLGAEANKLWIWTALDRATGRLIDWECGDRDQMTVERLLARLRRWKVRLFCTDEYVVYELALSVGQHYAGKDQTVALERTHSRLRHWLAQFRRRTCVVSRSKQMIDRSIALMAHCISTGQ
jgi:insertion element IS1 protein InsB